MSEYSKPFLNYEDQADLLISRGLIADKDELIRRLQSVSYYRLSGYLFPYRQKEYNDDSGKITKVHESFEPETSLELVWERYCFDRRLRVLLLDAIERIEVAVRSRLVYYFTEKHGPFGYLDDKNLPKITRIQDYLEFRIGLQVETARSKEDFKKEFLKKYKSHRELPLWMVAELMSMGNVLTLLKGVEPEIKRKIADEFQLSDEIMLSWFGALYAARNICAHHARIWNRKLGNSAFIPKERKNPEWSHGGQKFVHDRSATLLFICRHWLHMISPTSQWYQRVETLLDQQKYSPLKGMALPEDWKEHPIWTQNF